MDLRIKNITGKSWFQGGSGGFLAGVCCILHALALAIGFSAGAAFFGQWMVQYRGYLFVAGILFMMVVFIRNIKRHKLNSKKTIFIHLVTMLLTFFIVFALLNVYLFIIS
ncbi:MAG: hypothetical protein PHU36_02665 [Syntrophomonadaceae bacterium]|nr:hypothetical protein [Syntrophomonadaceae bacterium]